MLFSSLLGIIHTLIGVIALLFAITSLVRVGKISPTQRIGKLYIVFTVLASTTSFGVMKTGHMIPAHFLALLILFILPFGIYFQRSQYIGKLAELFGIVAMTLTLFLSFIPTIIETLTRVPLGHPIASSDQDPVIKLSILVLLSLFGVIIFLQVRKGLALRKRYFTTN